MRVVVICISSHDHHHHHHDDDAAVAAVLKHTFPIHLFPYSESGHRDWILSGIHNSMDHTTGKTGGRKGTKDAGTKITVGNGTILSTGGTTACFCWSGSF